ncbi:hypothetical protein HW132_17510 [Brasilonema sp. CT11]|nr:hypothetical protein [Brasilonema sp. CT11]
MTQVIESSATFKEDKYLIAKSFVADPLLRVAYNYALMMEKVGKVEMGGLQVLKTPIIRYDVFLETLLEEVRPKVELATGTKLYPTYAYARIYKKGDILSKHKDRPACEVAVTLTLGSDGSTSWPIYLNGPKGVSEIYLNPGDAVLYRGCEVEHWRESFDGNRQVQLFLFYVEQNGLNAEWQFDKRGQLGVRKRLTFKDMVNYLFRRSKLEVKRLVRIK